MVSQTLRVWLLTLVLAGSLIGAARAQEKTEEEKKDEEGKIVRIPAVTVSGTRLLDVPLDLQRYPGQVRVVSGDEIETFETDSVPGVIQYEPGLTLYNQTGNPFEPTLDMRGFSGEPVTETTVLLDGVRVNTPDFNIVDWDLLPVKDLQRIEVVPGTGSIFGKNALAGVVNLQTKRGGPVPEAKAELAGGSFGQQRYRASVGGPVAGFDYYLGFTQELADGFRQASDSNVTQLFAKVGRRMENAGTDVTGSFLFVTDHLEQPGSLPEAILNIDRTLNLTPGDFTDRTLYQGIVNLRQELPAGFSAALNGFIRDLDREFFTVGLTSQGTTHTSILSGGLTAQLTNEATFGDHRNVFVAGVEYTRNNVDNLGSSQFTGFPPFLSSTETDESVVGLYFQEWFDLIPEVLILSGGGRYDWDRIDFTDQFTPASDAVRTFQHFSPRAGVNWNVTEDVGLYFSYSEGFRSPTVNELFAFFPFSSNPDLAPPTGQTFEVGTRVRAGEYFEGTLALFQTEVDDEILFVVTDPTTGGGINQNVQKTRRRGLELTLRGRYGNVIDGFVNYSYIKATFETDAVLASGPVQAGATIPLVPRNRVGWGVNVHPVEGLTLSLAGLYVSSQFLSGDEANQSKPLDPYYVMNGQVSYRRGPLTLFVQGNNITDAEYEVWGLLAFGGERFLMPAPGASVFGGIILELSGFYK